MELLFVQVQNISLFQLTCYSKMVQKAAIDTSMFLLTSIGTCIHGLYTMVLIRIVIRAYLALTLSKNQYECYSYHCGVLSTDELR